MLPSQCVWCHSYPQQRHLAGAPPTKLVLLAYASPSNTPVLAHVGASFLRVVSRRVCLPTPLPAANRHRSLTPSLALTHSLHPCTRHTHTHTGKGRYKLMAADLVATSSMMDHIGRYLPSVRMNGAAFSFVVDLIINYGNPVLHLVMVGVFWGGEGGDWLHLGGGRTDVLRCAAVNLLEMCD